jgi:hypothetical protein
VQNARHMCLWNNFNFLNFVPRKSTASPAVAGTSRK